MRCFVGVDLPDSIKEEIYNKLRELQKKYTDFKWVPRENLHITLKFLGEIEEKLGAELRKNLQLISKEIKPFKLKIHGFGGFPSLRSPRVLWIGVEDKEDQLKKIHLRIEEISRKFGIKGENRDFSPHLTVARIKTFIDLRGENFPKIEKEFWVSSFTFFESILKPEGAMYKVIEIYSFTHGS